MRNDIEDAVSIRDPEGAQATGSAVAAASSPITARLLGFTERLPEKYADDPLFKTIYLDPMWIWVAEQDGRVIGYLIAAPAHNSNVTLLRVRIDEEVPPHGLLVLSREFFRDMRKRNIQGMFSHFDLSVKTERQIAYGMVKFLGGKVFINVCAPIPKES